MADTDEKPKKPSFFGRIGQSVGNALFEQPKTIPVQTAQQSTATETPPTPSAKIVPPNLQFLGTQPSVSAEPVNQEMLDMLRERIMPENSVLDHFLETLRRLEKVLSDPVSRFKAAVAASGIDMNSLASEIDAILAKIPGERQLVTQKADNRISEITGANTNQLSTLTAQMADKERTITALTNEIRQLEGEKKTIQASSSHETEQIETARQAFLKAADAIASELNVIRIQLGGVNQ